MARGGSGNSACHAPRVENRIADEKANTGAHKFIADEDVVMSKETSGTKKMARRQCRNNANTQKKELPHTRTHTLTHAHTRTHTHACTHTLAQTVSQRPQVCFCCRVRRLIVVFC